MTLQEAIIHAKEQSKKLSGQCAAEHLQLAEWLEELQQLQKLNRWILVTEHLPDDDDVFVTVSRVGFGEFTDTDHYDPDCETWEYYDGQVTAWMPFPQPYEEGESNV